MRPGQNKRMRGRTNNNSTNSNRKGPNPLTRSYESNGPDVKIRGTANHVAEKYLQLARDAQSSGDPVMAESYLQHAEHYFRLIAAAQLSQQQNNAAFPRAGLEGEQEEAEDDDDFSGILDRFASPVERFAAPAPQPFAPPAQQNGQPYQERSFYNGNDRQNGERSSTDRQNGERPNGERSERQAFDRQSGERQGGERQNNDRQGYDRQERSPRRERSYPERSYAEPYSQERNQDRYPSERNGQERNTQDRNGQERATPDRNHAERTGQERFVQQDRPYREQDGRPQEMRTHEGRNSRGRSQREFRTENPPRNEPRPAFEPAEPKGLPAFITAPVRIQPESFVPEPEVKAFVPQPAEPATLPFETPHAPQEVRDEPGGFHLRPRRRRRTKAEIAADQAAGAKDPVGD